MTIGQAVAMPGWEQQKVAGCWQQLVCVRGVEVEQPRRQGMMVEQGTTMWGLTLDWAGFADRGERPQHSDSDL